MVKIKNANVLKRKKKKWENTYGKGNEGNEKLEKKMKKEQKKRKGSSSGSFSDSR